MGVVIVAAPLEYLGLHQDFSRPKPLCVFYALALGPAPVASALLSAASSISGSIAISPQAFDWYATDALGYSIVVPMLMTVHLDALRKMFGRDQIAVTMLLLGIVLGTLLLNFVARDFPIAFLVFPGHRAGDVPKGLRRRFIGLLMAAAYFMIPVLMGHGHFAVKPHSVREQIIVVQLFIAVIGFSVVLVGAALAERRRLEQGLASAIVRAETAREEAIVARDVAERANRLKSMFLATMSHELRTPLNAVIGFSELMQSQLYGPLGDRRYREYAGLIGGAGYHLLSLINDVLDMSKIEAGKFELHLEIFDIREIVRDCMALMRDRADQDGVALSENTIMASPMVDADRRALKQILLNLLSNAIKFTPLGGKAIVRVKSTGDTLFLSVEDNGVGIPADQVSRLGNPFVQIRSSAGASHEGTGLGLALVRALSEVHGGKLRIDSILNHGTTVSVIIPNRAHEEEYAVLPLARSA